MVFEEIYSYARGPIKLMSCASQNAIRTRLQSNFVEYMDTWKLSSKVPRVYTYTTTRGKSTFHSCFGVAWSLYGCKKFIPSDGEEDSDEIWEVDDGNISEGELEDILIDEEEYDRFCEMQCDGEYGAFSGGWLPKDCFGGSGRCRGLGRCLGGIEMWILLQKTLYSSRIMKNVLRLAVLQVMNARLRIQIEYNSIDW